MVNVLDFGMNVQDAVDWPRFHHQWMPDSLSMERGYSPGYGGDCSKSAAILSGGWRRRATATRSYSRTDGWTAPQTRAAAARPKDTELQMNHFLSTHLFVNHRLTVALLSRIQQAGIPAVEIFCARQHLDYRDKAQITELGHWFRDSGLKLHSLHSPMYNDEIWGRSGPHAVVTITEPVKSKRLPMVEEIKRALEIAEVIPFRYLVQHIGVSGEEYRHVQGGRGIQRAGRVEPVRAHARRGGAAGEYTQRAFQRRAAAALRGTHARGTELLPAIPATPT